MSLFKELKRRSVIRVSAAYVIIAWLLIQVLELAADSFEAPAWVMKMIITAAAIGFIPAALFSWAFELTPEGIKKDSEVDKSNSDTSHTAKKLDYVTIAAALGVAGLFGWQQINPPTSIPASVNSTEQTTSQENTSTETDNTNPETDAASIAVLPFTDLSPEGDQEYFSDGISEELLNVLAHVKEMKVAGRTSSFSFKGKNMDLREIGRILGVATILEGSVRKQGKRVRITAQLIKVDDGFHLWSENYDRDLTDIFAVQDEIALAISKALMPHLMGGDTPKPQTTTRTEVSAYEKFFEARQLVRARTFEGLNRARTLLDEIITADPGYAPAYALQAQVAILLSDMLGGYGTTPVPQALAAAYPLVDKALELDPNLADAYASQGFVLSTDEKSEQAITAFRKAIDLNPNHLAASMWLAIELTADRRYRDKADTLQDIFNKDPLFGPIGTNLIGELARLGEFERAQVVVNRLVAIDPNSTKTMMVKAGLEYRRGRIGAATQVFKTLFEMDSNLRMSDAIAGGYLDLGAQEVAREFGGPIYDFWASLTQGDFDRAEKELIALLAQSPNNAFFQNQYLWVLNLTKRDDAAIKYFNDTWQDLREFESKVYNPYSDNPPNFDAIAQSYKNTGDEENFAKVMRRWRTTIDLNRAGGLISWRNDWEEAKLLLLSDDPEGAITVMDAAFERDTILPIYALGLAMFDDVRQNPNFMALDTKNRKRLNEERALLDLPPLPEK